MEFDPDAYIPQPDDELGEEVEKVKESEEDLTEGETGTFVDPGVEDEEYDEDYEDIFEKPRRRDRPLLDEDGIANDPFEED